jgi:hypothetical protein
MVYRTVPPVDIDSVQAHLLFAGRGWATVMRVRTGCGEVVLMVSPDPEGGESFVLSVRTDQMTGDVVLDGCGKTIVDDMRISSTEDLDILVRALPRPWSDAVINTAGLERLEVPG